MQEIITEFNSLSNEIQGFITIVALFIGLIALVKLIQGTIYIINNIPTTLLYLKKFLLGLWLIISFPFRMIIRFIKWILGSKERKEYRKYLCESEFAIDYEACNPPFFKRLFSRRIRKEIKQKLNAIEESIDTVSKIASYAGTINFVDGTIGSGKTSFQSGLSHVKTFIHISKINEKEDNTKKILYMLDFDYIDNLIERTYQTNKNVHEVINEVKKDSLIEPYLVGIYDNYRQTTPIYSLLKDYIVAHCARLRNNYVMANFPLFNRITNTFNMQMPKNLLNIKDKEAQKEYYNPAYCSIIEDELTLSEKNNQSLNVLEESGRWDAMRLFRQLKNETNDITSSCQNSTRLPKGIRELGNTFFMIENRREIGLLKSYSRKFQKKENKLINKLEKIKIKDKKDNKQKINEIKKKIYELYQFQNRIYASGFVEYSVRITHSFKDLEKYDQSDLSIVKFVFPLTWCYGTYRTCQHSDLDEVLNKISKKTDDDLVIINDFYETNVNYEELLKSASEKKLEKEKLLEQEKEKKRKEKEKLKEQEKEKKRIEKEEQKKAKEKEKDEHE